jgi:ferredoxin
MPTIRVVGGGAPFECDDETPLLVAMARQALAEIPVGCRRGGCGVCKVRVVEGRYRSAKMSRAHVSVEEQKDGWVLACRITPETDLVIERPKTPAKASPFTISTTG